MAANGNSSLIDSNRAGMISIVVPAHNERSVVARTLSQWVGNPGGSDPASGEIEVVVVCNGCTDDTAAVARRFGPTVRVVESDIARKTHALNLGDQISAAFPRIYADADIVITLDAIRALARRLEQGDVLAVAPTADINLTGCSSLVRRYYGIRSRLPSSREGIGGSGVYALSEVGRGRFGLFPDIVADDTYVRLQFRPEERETLPCVSSTVFPPRTVLQLIAVRSRVYRGTLELARRFPELNVHKGEANHRALISLIKELHLWPGLLIYFFVNVLARCRATFWSRSRAHLWQRDETSRAALSADSLE
ncbi:MULTISPECIES: glycosyltransferase [unclassified Bradyrhizobium]|uniref:glycosyltransferase n=1 Tax=unclassified Bradyrhizobium TaxID=2631580 RepID=UPI001FFAE643|nr:MULTISPECIES: glycosyltransferase [unclassified Bradyrhizobium]